MASPDDSNEPRPPREPRRRRPGEQPAPRTAPEPEPPADPGVRAFRAQPHPPKRPAQTEPAPASDTPHLDTNDLLAIASMDPSELAALMEGSIRQTRLEIGTRVTGAVTRVGRETVFVDLGGKSEGQIERQTVPDAKVGTELTAYVVSVDENGIELSLTLSGRAAAEHLEEARASGLPVEGKVTSRNSGGFEVRIGTARAFCPISLISRIPEVDLDAFVGQTLQFRVVETGDKIVVNRRVLQEEEAESKAAQMWTTLAEGQQHRGIVRSVQPFGFFVDLGGVDGLVPKREISWKVVDDPRTAVRVGQAVEVVILEIDHERRKLTLSAKALEDDPWTAVGVAFHEGGVYRGLVVRAETFGVFVELAPGLDGLIHSSKLVRSAGSNPADAGTPAVGTSLDVRLLSIDRDRKRLELAPVAQGEAGGEASSSAPAGDQRVRGTVADVLRNGVVVQLDDGRTGWLPENEVDLPSGTVLAQRFRKGKPIEARLVKEDPRRPLLSMRAATDEEERSWKVHQAQTRGSAGAASGSFGTLGDLLGGLKLKK